MNRYTTWPICPKCRQEYPFWENDLTASQLKQGWYDKACSCGHKLSIIIKQVTYFDVSTGDDSLDNAILIDKPMSVWVGLGRRDDGTLYVGSPFQDEISLDNFYENYPQYPCIAKAKFTGTFKIKVEVK